MDFFEQANQYITNLNENEKKIFEYITRNIHEAQRMQIRLLAQRCYVSTTTIMRFVKKLGFTGYRDFRESLRYTCQSMDHTKLPKVLWKAEYSEEYLKNIMESVRVLDKGTVEHFRRSMKASCNLVCFGTGIDGEAAHYAYRMFSLLGYGALCPGEDYEVDAALNRLRDGDVLFLFSLSGNDEKCVRFIEEARLRCKPVVATLTQSANNSLQGLSDIDFYVFTDSVTYKNADMSARVSMIATIELLVYSLLSETK